MHTTSRQISAGDVAAGEGLGWVAPEDVPESVPSAAGGGCSAVLPVPPWSVSGEVGESVCGCATDVAGAAGFG
jgi:hypothetical protein